MLFSSCRAVLRIFRGTSTHPNPQLLLLNPKCNFKIFQYFSSINSRVRISEKGHLHLFCCLYLYFTVNFLCVSFAVMTLKQWPLLFWPDFINVYLEVKAEIMWVVKKCTKVKYNINVKCNNINCFQTNYLTYSYNKH